MKIIPLRPEGILSPEERIQIEQVTAEVQGIITKIEQSQPKFEVWYEPEIDIILLTISFGALPVMFLEKCPCCQPKAVDSKVFEEVKDSLIFIGDFE